MARFRFSRTFVRYVVAQVPGWIFSGLVAWGLVHWFDTPTWAVILLIGLWIAKDLASFPSLRRFYEATPGEPWIVGYAGTAVTDLAPSGFVRVYGELWQAESAVSIAKGSCVRVRDIRGLRLIVDVAPEAHCDASPRQPSPPANGGVGARR